MDKLTKIGLTALAGSLATIAGANAGSLSISGGSDITYLSTSSNSGGTNTTGNPIGWKNNMTVSGAGELDNGISWTAMAYNSDAQALTSSNISFDLAGAGSLLLDNGAGGAGLDALDDKMPTAWEETHGTGITAGVVTVTGVHGSASLTYGTPADALPMGTKIRIGYTPRADGGSLQADLGNSGTVGGAGDAGKGSAMDITVEMTPVDGLNVFAGYAEIEQGKQPGAGAGTDDQLHGTYGATFTAGAVTVGYQQSYVSYDNGTTTATNYYDNTNWGVAFNVNDNLSISYGEYESEENLGASGGQTLDIDSIQLTYNMGGATLKIAETEAEDAQYAADRDNKATTIALGLAF